MAHNHRRRFLVTQRATAFLISLIASVGLVAHPVWAGKGLQALTQTQTATQTQASSTQKVAPNAGSFAAEEVGTATQLSEQERVRRLGIDPAIGYTYRESESRTAQRIESRRGIQLKRAPKSSTADWVGPRGETYDAVGNFSSKYFDHQWPNLKRQIDRHLNKAHWVPVDVSRFTKRQQNQVQQFIQEHPEFDTRVFVVGEEEAESSS